jgi:hypothetical protein
MNILTSQIETPLAKATASKHKWRTFARQIPPSVFEVVMLFDEDDAREAGKDLCDRVLAQLGPCYAIHLLPWKLSVTRFPQLTEIVAREAMRAPFVVVTINGAKALTPDVESFIQRCAVAMHRGGAALVAQLYGVSKDEQELSPAYRCLKQIADDSTIPIFSTVVELNQNRGAGRASPRRSESPFVAFPPQTLALAS